MTPLSPHAASQSVRLRTDAAAQKNRTLAGPVLSCECWLYGVWRPSLRPGLPGTPPSSSFEREGSPWLELPGSQPSGPLPTPWLQRCRGGGGLLDDPSQPVAVRPVTVTAARASASPLKVPRVRVIAAPARMVPAKFESVIVAAAST